MRLPLPRSLAAQMAVLLGCALLVAQLFNFALVLNERQKVSLAQVEGPAIGRFAQTASDLQASSADLRPTLLREASRRGARFLIDPGPRLDEGARDDRIERRLRAALADEGIANAEVRAGLVQRSWRGRRGDRSVQLLMLGVREADGSWLNARIVTPRRDPWLVARLGAATALLYGIVLGATLWIALRLARPLRDLTRAAESFGGRTPAAPVIARGPADLRQAIEAFNAMNVRLLALLDEKDRMLGAIGHDIRTPLASLRIRIESMEPPEEREAAIAKIAEMGALLEDILVLARSGRAREDARPTDIGALVEALVEDARALGQDVTATVSARCVAPAQQRLLRRAIANLIDNAVKYGIRARVSVGHADDMVAIRIEDDGPGIPHDEIAHVLQPFYRLEGSRNRETGGTGLGLAIAQSVAESHGGRLILAPGAERGLVAILTLPA